MGALWQDRASEADRRHFPAPGRLVDVGGHRLHLLCLGEGQPTVLLEAGATAWSAGWAWVQVLVAEHTRVCAYDRAGLGWSEPGPAPRDGPRLAGELARLLEAGEIAGPYVLAGHSMGGLTIRIYAAAAPDRVAGLVFVDPSHPDQFARIPAEARAEYLAFFRLLAWLPAYARLGGTRLHSPLAALAHGLPEEARMATEAAYATTGHLAASLAELEQWDATSRAAGGAGTLGDRPVIVLTAGMADARLLPTIALLHQEIAALSSQGEQRTVPGAGHVGLLTDRKHAEVTAAAILEVVTRVRAERR